MKCRIKDLRFYEGDVLILDGHKHTFYRQHSTGSVEFLIGGGFVHHGPEVEVDFGEWLERPTLKLFEEFGLDITKLEA